MRHLAIFAKYWQPGQVKTRLAQAIGKSAAAQIHRIFLETIVSRCATAFERRSLVYTPLESRDSFATLSAGGWSLVPQAAGDLGVRMKRFLEDCLVDVDQRVVLLGADSPNLPLAIIEDAFVRLETADAVLGPSTDGGYYLVGCKRRMLPIFDGIDWGTGAVWPQTMARLRDAGITPAVLPEWYDIDELADLKQLRGELSLAASTDPALARLERSITSVLHPDQPGEC